MGDDNNGGVNRWMVIVHRKWSNLPLVEQWRRHFSSAGAVRGSPPPPPVTSIGITSLNPTLLLLLLLLLLLVGSGGGTRS